MSAFSSLFDIGFSPFSLDRGQPLPLTRKSLPNLTLDLYLTFYEFQLALAKSSKDGMRVSRECASTRSASSPFLPTWPTVGKFLF